MAIIGLKGQELFPVFPEDKKELERILSWSTWVLRDWEHQHLLIFRRVQARGDVFGYNARGLKAAEKYAKKLSEQEGIVRDAPMGRFHTAFIPEVMWYRSEMKREDGSPVGAISGYQVVEWSALEDPEDLPFESLEEVQNDS